MVLASATRSGHVEINAARLYYEERGAGPSLLLIPGGTVDATHHAAVADLLADDFRTVTYDRRANGRSPRPSGWHATSIAEQADDAAGLIEALGLAPCAVWGGSLGGVVLLELLVRRPALVGAALVHEPPLFAVLDDGEQAAKGLLASAARAIRHSAVREEFRNHVRLSIGEAFEQLPPHLRERMFANATVFFDLEIPALVDHRPEPASLRRVLRRVDVPVTVMGDPHNHAALPFRAACWLADQLGTELRELSGGHMPYAATPEATAAAIRRALTD
ncbi:alpha/beta fold hydrolase [Pseudonocardia adelaidensis]|uniref:Alpha/beta hydrolase n=1 Tax=Pseudonocardia adelaidensis TaxID=648754 RepID=A0ABP9PAG2_9PSEU